MRRALVVFGLVLVAIAAYVLVHRAAPEPIVQEPGPAPVARVPVQDAPRAVHATAPETVDTRAERVDEREADAERAAEAHERLVAENLASLEAAARAADAAGNADQAAALRRRAQLLAEAQE